MVCAFEVHWLAAIHRTAGMKKLRRPASGGRTFGRLRTVLADRPKERRVNLVPAARLHAGVEEGHGDDDLEDGA